MNRKTIVLFCILWIIPSCLISCMAIERVKADLVLDHSICTNTHMGYKYYDYDYREEMCKSIGEMKVGMIRDYVFNNSSNSFDPINGNPQTGRAYVFNNVLYNLHKYAPNTQVLGVLHDRRWAVDKDVPISKFLELVKKAVKTYNGETIFVPTDYGKEMSFEIKYWEICNEMDWGVYDIPPFDTAEKTFHLIKSTYHAIKEANPNAVVVFPGVAYINGKFLKDMFEFSDEDGKRIWDFFDVFNFHHYPSAAEDLISAIKMVNDYKAKYGWNKPVWLTEVGWSELIKTEDEVAINYPKAYLMAFAYGIDKVFMFQHRRFDYNCTIDASLGILRSSMDATYISLLSGGNPLSKGSAFEHILIKENELDIPLINHWSNSFADYLLGKLKKNGLEIKGKDYVIEKVVIHYANKDGKKNKQILFAQETDKEIKIPSSAFVNCDINDTIKIYFKKYKKDIKWKSADKTKTYYAMKELMRHLPDGSSDISLEIENGIYICRWLDKKGKKQMAIWSEKDKHVRFDTTKKIKGVNHMGNKLSIPPDGITLNKGIVYINGHYNYTK